VPARLVRRDPETQVVITRERIMEEAWRKLDLDDYTKVGLEAFLEEQARGAQALDTVLTVPKRGPDIKKRVAGLRKLQAAGIAEPD
jgi:hypothetical protein